MEELTLERFGGASELVEDVTTETKLVHSEYFSAQTGNEVFFKPENMQYTDVYKVRGAYYKIRTLAEEEKPKGLITASAGNHVQGVAYAAKLASVKTTVVIPTTTLLMKVNRTKSYGTDMVLEGDMFNEACDHAYKLAEEFGYTFVHPSDDLDVTTGQGTIAMKIIKELPTVDYILVPIGGGGFCTGVSALVKLLNPKIKVIGVEPAGANCMQVSLKEGKVVGLPQVNTVADGTAVKRPGEKLFPYIQENVDNIITIEGSELIVIFLDVIENHGMVVENSGLLTVTALKHLNVQKKKIVSILSGGNMDVITMSSIMQHDLVERNRVSTVSVLLPDKPGELVGVSALLAKEQSNIIKLKHNQLADVNRNAAMELRITMEALGTERRNQIVSTLTSADYRPKLVKFKGTYSKMQASGQKDTGGNVVQPEEHTVTHTISHYRSFRYELILGGVVAGALTGAVVVALRYLIGSAGILLSVILDYGKSHAWFVPMWILILVVTVCVVSLPLKWDSLISGSSIPQIERKIIGEIDEKWWHMLFTKLGRDITSLGCGLSLGRGGPSIQLGVMTAKGFSRTTRRVKTEEKLLITCGASAGLSVTFSAPIVGILLSLEKVHKHFSPEFLLSSVVTSITSDFVSRDVFGLTPAFSFHITHMMPPGTYGHVLVLSVLMGAMGAVYNTTLSKTQDLYGKTPWDTAKPLIPFLLAGVFGFTYRNVLDGDHVLVRELSTGKMALGALCLLLVIKLTFNIVSFGSRAPGGIFLPLSAMEAIIGSIYYNAALLVNPSLSNLVGDFIILGVAGYFSAIVRAPITGIVLINEMTRSFSHLLTLPMVPLAAYLVPDMVHYAPVYDQLLHHLLAKQNPDKEVTPTGEKVLMEDMIYHGNAVEGKKVPAIAWPRASLVVSLIRGEVEFVPRGDTAFRAGDKIVVLYDKTSQGRPHKALQEYYGTVAPMQRGQ